MYPWAGRQNRHSSRVGLPHQTETVQLNRTTVFSNREPTAVGAEGSRRDERGLGVAGNLGQELTGSQIRDVKAGFGTTRQEAAVGRYAQRPALGRPDGG